MAGPKFDLDGNILDDNHPLPVAIQGAGAGTTVVGAVKNTSAGVNETSTPLAGGATFNGVALDTGMTPGAAAAGTGAPAWSKFRVMVFADAIGTLNIQQSRDGVTWRTTLTQAIVASTALILESMVVRKWVRAQVVNGAGVQTVFELDTLLLAES